MAGRKVKCKCGQIMVAPDVQPPAPPVEEAYEDDDDLYALAGDKPKVKRRRKQMLPEGTERCPACESFLVIGAKICVQCGYDLVTQKAPPKPTAPVDDGTTAFKEETPSPPPPPVHKVPVLAKPTAGPKLAYQSAPVKQQVESVIEGSPGKDFWVPIVLILLGTIVEFVAYTWGSSDLISSLAAASVIVGVGMVINVATLFIGILIAAKVAGMGFGHPLQAVLKLSAIAIAVPAVQHLVTVSTGMGLIGMGISLVVYFALFMWLFELDASEAQIVVGIVWVINILTTIFLAGVLLGMLG